MTGRVRAWWGLRSLREQRMLLLMAALLLPTLAWLLVVRPLDDALGAARGRHERAVIDLAVARGQAERIAALEGGARPAEAALATVIGRRAAEAGFAEARVTNDTSRRATIAIDAARPRALFGFLAALERRDGLIVERMNARANSDATLAADAVIRLRSR